MSSEDTAAPAKGAPAPAARRRLVAIVGRPNVGKSAIFNRIAGRRIAIVHDESGVTRDRISRPVFWGDQPFELVDTGGLNLLAVDSSNSIETGVVEQARAALDDAAVAILAVDVRTGLTPVDEEVARLVRTSGVPCLVAANKCDLPQHEHQTVDFASLNLPVFPVSALHDRGFGPLMDRVLQFLPDVREENVANPLRVAIVGKPNAGKSSFINRLLRNPRVIVSEIAGTTRDSIEVPFTIGAGRNARHYQLVDTAGMRNVHRIDSAVERFSHFRAEAAIKEADVAVLVLDASAGPSAQDKRIAAVIARENKSCVVLVNKWDLAHDNPDAEVTETKYEPEFRKAMPFLSFCPIVFVSAKSGYNVRRALDVIDEVAANTRAKLSTGLLNRVVADAYDRVKPPSSGRRHFKIFYATQTGNAPLRIRLFVNDSKMPGANYTAYLVKALREAFGLEGVPVVIDYYNRARADDDKFEAQPPQEATPGAAAKSRGAHGAAKPRGARGASKSRAAKGAPKPRGARGAAKPRTAKGGSKPRGARNAAKHRS